MLTWPDLDHIGESTNNVAELTAATGDSLCKGMELDYDYVDWYGRRRLHHLRPHRQLRGRASFPRHYGVIQPIMSQTWMAVYADVTKRCVLISPECKHGLVHLLSIENLERNEQVEVIHRQAGNNAKQLRF